MKTEHRLAEALKSMMSQMSLDEISVIALTKKCHINRQTFYYHFHDVYDLLAQVFLDEKIPNINKVGILPDLEFVLYNYYEKNAKFIDATLNSAGRDLFQEFIFNKVYQVFYVSLTQKIYEARPLSINDKKAIARFYGFAFADSFVYYLCNSQVKSLDGFKQQLKFLRSDFLDIAVDTLLKVRGLHG